MKNYFRLTIIGLFLCSGAHAQYEAGDIDFNLSTGVGVYGLSTNESDDGSDSSNNMGASGLLAFTGNYAVVERVSIGVNVERNGFIIGNDDSTVTNNDRYLTTLNYRLNTEFRLLNSEKNSIALQALIGMTSLSSGDRSSSDKLLGSGMTYEVRFAYKHFFGEHFGYFLNAAYANYTYNQLTDEDGDVWKTSDDEDISVTFSGANIRLGFTYRL